MTTEDTALDDPDEHPLRFVPVRTIGSAQVLRLFRQRDGSRCVVAFSTAEALHTLLGPAQEAAELAEPALRELTEPLGVHSLILDPKLVAPAATDPQPVPATLVRERQW